MGFFFKRWGGGEGGSQPNEIENQRNEICSHLSEKTSKGTFLKPEKLQNHSNERKGKEKKKERGEGKEEKKKSNGCTLSFYNSYFRDSF